MTRITILGGTGYAGGHIAAEAASRGHEVTSYSRGLPGAPVDGVTYETGSVTDDGVLDAAVRGAEVVVATLSPRGDMPGRVRPTYASLARVAKDAGVRILVIGGAGSLLAEDGGQRLLDGDFPDDYRPEALELTEVLDELRVADAALDWTYLSPAEVFGPWAEGERTGAYRTGGDVVVRDAEGSSVIGGADLGVAVVDEIERPAHRRERFTIAY